MKLSVLIAPDSFKGSLPATRVAAALKTGWLSVRPGDDVRTIPLADGGEGTIDALESIIRGARRRSTGLVPGPDGYPTYGQWLELPGGTAIIELAQMAGLPLMRNLDALHASTTGMGNVIGAALDSGAAEVIIGAGGSASTDGGAGALVALGLQLLNSNREPIRAGGQALAEIHHIDRTTLRAPPTGGAIVLSDVSAPLVGPTGAAAVFGPQKGASPAQVDILDRALNHFAQMLGGDIWQPGAGAAGGVGFGFATAWNARITSGARHIMALTGADQLARSADVVITGEGRFDQTSLQGKLVGEMLDAAALGEARIAVIAGTTDTANSEPSAGNLWQIALADLAGSPAASMERPEHWLRTAAAVAARGIG